MAKPKLTLYLDIVSPFAYLAFYVTKVYLMELHTSYNYMSIDEHDLTESRRTRPSSRIAM